MNLKFEGYKASRIHNKKVIDRKLIAMNFFLQKFNYLNFPLEMHKTEYLAEDSLMNLT